jgi:hypothetical protein
MDTKNESFVHHGHDAYIEHNDPNDENIDPSVPVRYRGTDMDKRDMKMIGKTQVLRVCFPLVRVRAMFYLQHLAEFQVRRYAWIRVNGHGVLGDSASVRTL